MNRISPHCPKSEITLTVNGKPKPSKPTPMERLLDVLRDELGLTGTKEGCGEGECGSCSVLIDGDTGEQLPRSRSAGERGKHLSPSKASPSDDTPANSCSKLFSIAAARSAASALPA